VGFFFDEDIPDQLDRFLVISTGGKNLSFGTVQDY